MSDDLISIGIPVYNGERYLESAIRSNLDQTVSNIELIVSDNASTDRTEEICRDFAAMDERVRYYRSPVNIGAAQNYNRLFKLSRGAYFRWSNADDLAALDLIEHTLPVLRDRPDVVIAFGRTSLIDADGNFLRHYVDDLDLQYDSTVQRYTEFYRRLGLTNIIYGLLRSSAMRQTALMGSGKLPAGDVSFMAAMILLGKFVAVPELLFYRRIHEGAFSANSDPEQQRNFWKASTSEVAMPHWRAQMADVRAVLRAPLPANEKVSLLKHTAKRLYWDRRILAGDVKALAFRRMREN